MFKDSIPVMYWPAAIAFIDDEAGFLETATSLFLRHKTYPFSDPEAGVAFINQQRPQVSLEKEYQCNEEDEAKDYLVHLSVKHLRKKLQKPKRFDELAVLVIDFKMPHGDGLFYLNQVTNARLKKILLTGVANNDQAVEAFNAGKIHRYLKKLANDSDLKLKHYVNELQAEYFCDASKTLLEELPELQQLLKEPEVINFFNEFMKQHKIKEFCLLEDTGTFLLNSYDGQQSMLCLQTAKAKDEVIGGLKLRDDVNDSIIEPIIAAQKLTSYLFMNSELANGNLQKYCFDCHPILDTSIHYAHIHDLDVLI